MGLILAVTGATGAYAAKLFLEKSPVPVSLVASTWGKDVCARECGGFESLVALADKVYGNRELDAAISSGSVPNDGMVVLPCSANTLGKMASGICDSLITRAAHCQLKERRPLVLCVRETPWTGIDLENAARLDRSGAVIMPMSEPFYMFASKPPAEVTMHELLEAYVDRVLKMVGF